MRLQFIQRSSDVNVNTLNWSQHCIWYMYMILCSLWVVPSSAQRRHVLTSTELQLQSWLILDGRCSLNDGQINFPPAFKNYITWDEFRGSLKWNGHKGNVSPSKCTLHALRMHTEQTYVHESAIGNGQRTLWLGQYGAALYSFSSHTSRKIHIYPPVCCRTSQIIIDSFTNIQWWETDVINWQARRGSSSDGTNTAAAVTQWCRLFYSDSLQMPPGREAKINTICSVTGMQ